jgi:hypothetical protein
MDRPRTETPLQLPAQPRPTTVTFDERAVGGA